MRTNKQTIMSRLRPLDAAVTLASAFLLVACSDPSNKVHQSAASDPSTSAPPVETATTSATAATSSQAGKAYVVRSESTIGFTGSKVTGHHNGGFKNFAGTFNVERGKIVGTPAIQIGMKSTWADNERLTGHLKSADFFDVGKFPLATFTVKTIEPAGAAQKVTGDLNLHGVIKTISFPANI